MVGIDEKKDPSLKDYFSLYNYVPRYRSDNVLEVDAKYSTLYYDFLACVMVTTDHNHDPVTVTPFAQLDRTSLVRFHEKLTSLGGKPPPLSSEITGTAPLKGLSPPALKIVSQG